jgi:hypothetical protein
LTPRRSHPCWGAYDGATTPMVSPFISGAGLLRPGDRVIVDVKGCDGALSIGVIGCSAGYAPSDSLIVFVEAHYRFATARFKVCLTRR